MNPCLCMPAPMPPGPPAHEVPMMMDPLMVQLAGMPCNRAVGGRGESVQRGCGPPVNCPNACPATTRPTGAIRAGQRGQRHSHNPAVVGRRESVHGSCGPPVNYPNAGPATTRPTGDRGHTCWSNVGSALKIQNSKILLSDSTASPSPWP